MFKHIVSQLIVSYEASDLQANEANEFACLQVTEFSILTKPLSSTELNTYFCLSHPSSILHQLLKIILDLHGLRDMFDAEIIS